MREGSPELNASVLSNPEARHAYYEQRRQNTTARERHAREQSVVNLLADIAQLEIESATKKPLPADDREKLRARIKLAVSRIDQVKA